MQNEEVDLVHFYHSFKQTFVFKKLILFSNFVRSNKYWFILFLIFGVSIGYFIKRTAIPVYKSEMLLKSRYLNNNSTFELVKTLSVLIEENNKAELNNLGFSDEVVKSINKIEFVYPDEITDSLIKQEPFKVVVESNKNQLFPCIGEAIHQYLSKNPASMADENKNKVALVAEISELKKKLVDLDSLQSLIYGYFYSNRKELKSQPMIVDPASVLRERRETFAKLVEMEKNLSDINNYIVIQKMKSKLFPMPKSNKPIIVLSFVFLFAGGLILFVTQKPATKEN
jgi:hypothetical protein